MNTRVTPSRRVGRWQLLGPDADQSEIITLVDRTGRYSNRSVPGTRLGLLDLLIRCEKELLDLAALLREGNTESDLNSNR